MSININTNATAVNWETLLNKIGEAAKTEGSQGVADTRSVTFTTTVDGIATPVTLNIPDDLELPATVDSAAIESLCEKLLNDPGLDFSEAQIKQIHDTLANTLQSLSSAVSGDTKTKSLMFDLYKMMALLVEVAQKQRDAMREMRLSENLAVQKSILDQADAQRTAAMTGMIAGAICCTLQVAATSVAMYQQAKAFNAQLGTDKTSGLDIARQNVDMVKTAATQGGAEAQLAKVKAEIGDKLTIDGDSRIVFKVESSFSNAKMNEAAANYTSAKNAFEAKTTLSETMQYLGSDVNINNVTADMVGGIDAPEVANVKTALQRFEACKAELDVKLGQLQGFSPEDKAFLTEASAKPFNELSMGDKTRLMNLKASHPELGQMDFTYGGKTLSQLKADIKTAFDTTNANLKEQLAPTGKLATDVETAKANLRAQTKLEVQKFEDVYDNALKDYNEATKTGTKADIAAAETKLQTAADQLKYARALGNAKLMTAGLTDAKTHLADVNEARTAYQAAQTARSNNVDYIKASNTITQSQATNNLIAAIGNFAQNFIQNLTQMQHASATEQGALQKKSEEELDQTRDLFSQALTLVDSIVKLMQAVRAAEAQSMRDAIQA